MHPRQTYDGSERPSQSRYLHVPSQAPDPSISPSHWAPAQRQANFRYGYYQPDNYTSTDHAAPDGGGFATDRHASHMFDVSLPTTNPVVGTSLNSGGVSYSQYPMEQIGNLGGSNMHNNALTPAYPPSSNGAPEHRFIPYHDPSSTGYHHDQQPLSYTSDYTSDHSANAYSHAPTVGGAATINIVGPQQSGGTNNMSEPPLVAYAHALSPSHAPVTVLPGQALMIQNGNAPNNQVASPARQAASAMRRTNPVTHWCTVCSAGFTTQTHLKDHMKVHMGEFGYPCQEAGCFMAFNTRGGLRSHVRHRHRKD